MLDCPPQAYRQIFLSHIKRGNPTLCLSMVVSRTWILSKYWLHEENWENYFQLVYDRNSAVYYELQRQHHLEYPHPVLECLCLRYGFAFSSSSLLMHSRGGGQWVDKQWGSCLPCERSGLRSRFSASVWLGLGYCENVSKWMKISLWSLFLCLSFWFSRSQFYNESQF